jgi:hypothetical protein
MWRRLCCLLLMLAAAGAALAAEGAPADVENQIKASYLYKFATYVDWPGGDAEPAGVPLTIGVIGADSLAEELKKLSLKYAVKNHPVQVRMLKQGSALDGLQILFVGQHADAHAQALIDSVAGQPVLTVTESAGMLAAGSVINLVQVDDRIRFEVSLSHAKSGGLKISSRLLDVAYKIEGKSP